MPPRPPILRAPDARTREGCYVLRFREELLKRLDRPPSYVESVLIDRAALASLRLADLDAQLGGGRKINDAKYLAWTNSWMFALARLDRRRLPSRPRSCTVAACAAAQCGSCGIDARQSGDGQI
jgi:hypothetical protein